MNVSLKRVYSRNMIGIAIVALILLLAPIVVSSNYLISVLIMIGFYTLICTGMNMLMGYAGQISLGHSAFYGIGAYSSAYVTAKLGMSPLIGILAGVVITIVVAYLVGIPSLKLSGHYLALATLGFGMIVFTLFKQFKSITGGSDGFFGIPSLSLFGFQFTSEIRYYYLIWIVAILGILLARNVVQSRVGRAFRSIHASEIAAGSIGIDIGKYKLEVFIMSAVYASVAGSIYAHYVSFINPVIFESGMSIKLLMMSVIGGSGSIWGGLIGSGVYIVLGEVLKDIVPLIYHGQGSDQFEIIFFGILIVVLLMYMPKGLSSVLEKTSAKLTFTSRRAPGEEKISSGRTANPSAGDGRERDV